MRIAILGGIAMGMLGLLLIRLWFLQVISGEQYALRADGNRLRTVITQPPRGNILTRDGVPLVNNTTGENLVARPRELLGERRRQVLTRLAAKVGQPASVLIAKVAAGDDQPLQSVVLARDINPVLYRYLAERRRDFPGISLQKTYLRFYPQGDLAAHILGSTGPITADTLKAYRHKKYAGDETVGIDGVEKQYEAVLKGAPGKSVVEVDASGEPQGREYISSRSPVPGRDLRLSIDSVTQRALEGAIANAARVTGATGAAGVALDPNTGEVLALGSYPTFSPEAFVTRRSKQIEPILNDPEKPLNDRAIAGVYPAGSTFKSITAAAALQGGEITASTLLESSATITLHKQVFSNFHHESHGSVTLPQALKVSSDTFFYQVADRLWQKQVSSTGNDYPLSDEARKFGFGAPTGIDLPSEAAALVPDPPWKKRQYAGSRYTDFQRSWVAGDTINLGVGQGFLQVTPLQMAAAYAAIANGGTLYAPSVGMQVLDHGRVVEELSKGRPSRQIGVTATNLATIKQGLYDAANVTDGTSASVFSNLPERAKVAGKTGTVETGVPGEEDHSWFVGYAPFDNPRIVVAVIIEHGGTGANAAAPAVCSTMAAFLAYEPKLCGRPVVSH